jgi:small subunit ribosomal protein S24e
MDIEIQGTDAQPLLNRTELKARIAFQGATPTKKQVVEAVAKATGAKHDLVIVRRISTQFGSRSAEVLARVYNDKKSLETLEHKATLRKHGMLAEEKKDEKATEGAKGEKAAPKKEEKKAAPKEGEE